MVLRENNVVLTRCSLSDVTVNQCTNLSNAYIPLLPRIAKRPSGVKPTGSATPRVLASIHPSFVRSNFSKE